MQSFYLGRRGAKWRALPADFPPWRTVYTTIELADQLRAELTAFSHMDT